MIVIAGHFVSRCWFVFCAIALCLAGLEFLATSQNLDRTLRHQVIGDCSWRGVSVPREPASLLHRRLYDPRHIFENLAVVVGTSGWQQINAGIPRKDVHVQMKHRLRSNRTVVL